MRSLDDILAEMDRLEATIRAKRSLRMRDGVAEAMRNTAAIDASLAAAQLCALAYVLGEIESPQHRSTRLRWR